MYDFKENRYFFVFHTYYRCTKKTPESLVQESIGNTFLFKGLRPFYFSYCNRNIFNLRPGLVVFHNQVVCGEIIEIFNLRIQLHCRCRIWCSGNQFLDYRYMSVINMAVRNHMNQFSSFHITYLGNHH